MPNATQSITVKMPAEKAFDVITKFEDYPKFLPEMEKVKVLKKSAQTVRVSFVTNLVKRVEYTLDFSLKRPAAITWKLVDGDPIIKKNSGSWKLEVLEPKLTELTFSVEMEFNIWLPKMIADGLVKSHLPQMLENFKKRMEKKSAKK